MPCRILGSSRSDSRIGSSTTVNAMPDNRAQGESPTSFPEENTAMSYSGFEPEATWLHVEGHIHHTGWVAFTFVL
ncbi:hypothetical protein TNCV_2811341 [Trichonephila clavipes]|nr:hypothetical protein TNCV_2811341 [Trichonephila clavipes]